jgi:hypothetical protein
MVAALGLARIMPMTDLAAVCLALPFCLGFALLSYRLDPMLRDAALAAAGRIGIVPQPVATHSNTLS